MHRLIFLSLLIGSNGCLWEGEMPVLDGVDTRVTFLHTSDIHSRLFPFDLAPTATDRSLGMHAANGPYGGAARLGYLIRRERKRANRVLHFDSGDCFQGAPIFNQNMGEAEIRFMSMIGADAVVIGNHEFDAGASNYAGKLERWGAYDNLAANYIFPDPHDPNTHNLGELSAPYAIYNLGGLRVAVIGMANLGSLSSIGEDGNSIDITPLEQNETVRAYVRLIHDSVDLVVVVSHLGLTEDQELISGYTKTVWQDRVHPEWEIREDLGDGRVDVWIPGVRGIDIIMGGHLHIVLNPPKLLTDRDDRDVLLVHSGAFAKYLGRLDFVVRDDPEFGGKRVVSHKYQVFPVDGRLSQHDDTDIAEMLEPYLIDLNRALDLERIIAYAPRTILRRSQTGNGDSGLGNLVAEAMRTRRHVEAELAVTNTLGIRDNFYAGPITLEDMFNVFPFENTLTVMFLSGTELQELIDFITERSASRGCQSQAQVAGLSFTMNCGQVLQNERNPDDYVHPGEDILVNGVPFSNSATYKVATNDYIARGGSGFKVLKRNTTKIDTGVSMRDALIDHMATMDRCGTYEREVAKYCDRRDELSRTLCLDIGDPDRIQENLGDSQIVGVRGPYADTPCVVSAEDGRIRRQTSEGLDQLPDVNDPDVQP
ncbi:MAG: bifunctional UDP-sugar hydrolase/5'-nucleotidase [Myxococcota bacterium]